MVQHQSFDPLTQPAAHPEVEQDPGATSPTPIDQTWEAATFLVGWPGALIVGVASTFLVMDGSLLAVAIGSVLFGVYLAVMSVLWLASAAAQP
jgi:hypothetical protein